MKSKAHTIAAALLIILAAALSAACAAPAAPTPTPVQGVVLPFPEEEKQYRMSEVCQHLEDQGYDVKGTITHQFGPEDFEELLERIPALARTPVENYLSEGLMVEVEIQGLCGALNR